MLCTTEHAIHWSLYHCCMEYDPPYPDDDDAFGVVYIWVFVTGRIVNLNYFIPQILSLALQFRQRSMVRRSRLGITPLRTVKSLQGATLLVVEIALRLGSHDVVIIHRLSHVALLLGLARLQLVIEHPELLDTALAVQLGVVGLVTTEDETLVP